MSECDDCPKRDGWFCVDGLTYGFCDSGQCGGACEQVGVCDCKCHEAVIDPPRGLPTNPEAIA